MDDAERIKELVAKAVSGDQESFGVLYNEHLTPIYRFIYYRVRHKETAEDLSQTVFLKAFDSIGRFQERGLPFSSWLFTIARNQVLDHWKKKKDTPVEDLEATFVSLTDERIDARRDIDRADIARVLEEAIAVLSPAQQEVVVLRDLEERSYKEVGDIIGKREEAVRALHHRAMKVLKKELGTYNEK